LTLPGLALWVGWLSNSPPVQLLCFRQPCITQCGAAGLRAFGGSRCGLLETAAWPLQPCMAGGLGTGRPQRVREEKSTAAPLYMHLCAVTQHVRLRQRSWSALMQSHFSSLLLAAAELFWALCCLQAAWLLPKVPAALLAASTAADLGEMGQGLLLGLLLPWLPMALGVLLAEALIDLVRNMVVKVRGRENGERVGIVSRAVYGRARRQKLQSGGAGARA
jgi:hypothetical protein